MAENWQKHHNKTYFPPHKKAKFKHKMDLGQNSINSEQIIYPSPDIFAQALVALHVTFRKSARDYCSFHIPCLFQSLEEGEKIICYDKYDKIYLTI